MYAFGGYVDYDSADEAMDRARENAYLNGGNALDGANNFVVPQMAARGPRRRRGHVALSPIALSSDTDESGDEDENDPSMQDFVVNDDVEVEEVEESSADEGHSDATETASGRVVARRRAPVVISDDEDEGTVTTAGASREADVSGDDASEVDVVQSFRDRNGNSRRRPMRIIASDDESSGEENEHEFDAAEARGFSPFDGSVPGDAPSVHSGYDSPEPRSSVEPYPHPESESEEDDEDEDESEESDDEDEDEDDEDPNVHRPNLRALLQQRYPLAKIN